MIQKLFSEKKKTKRKLLIFGLVFIAVVGSVSGWVFKSYFKSNIERPVINIYTTSSHGYDNSIMYEGDIIINPLPLGLDNKTIQLNLQKKVNDFLVEYYKNKNDASRYIPKLRVQDLERKVLEVLDYYGNTLTGKVFTSDGEYDYEVSTNNRFTNRYNYLLGN